MSAPRPPKRGTAEEDVRGLMEQLWREGDPWELETSELDQQRYARQLELISDRRYGRVLEIGCGAGTFTERLASVAERVVALDIAPAAIEKANARGLDPRVVEFRTANVLDVDLRAEGRWDLVVLAETVYYLGWRYPLYDIGWLASEAFRATRPGGRLLIANTVMPDDSSLLAPWLIHTYHDLFRNVGYRTEREETLRGIKEATELEIRVSLLERPADGG